MNIRSSFLVLALAVTAVACAPAKNNFPPAGYDTTAPTLPDDPSKEGADPALNRDAEADKISADRFDTPNLTTNQKSQVLAKYNFVDQKKVIRTSILENAIVYYDANKSRTKNSAYLTVLDFSLPSNKQRLHVINMKTGTVWSLHVAHGKGSDANHDAYAEKFSNTSGSNASSLGAYLTAETYSGGKGYSLRLDGLSTTNSQARGRAIVIHGASYVQDANVKQGRSWGCPAVSMANRTKLIDMIKGGSIIFAAN